MPRLCKDHTVLRQPGVAEEVVLMNRVTQSSTKTSLQSIHEGEDNELIPKSPSRACKTAAIHTCQEMYDLGGQHEDKIRTRSFRVHPVHCYTTTHTNPESPFPVDLGGGGRGPTTTTTISRTRTNTELYIVPLVVHP